MLKRKKEEIPAESRFMEDEDYISLEKVAKKHPKYELNKIYFLMKIMEEFESIKNNHSSLKQSIKNISEILLP